MSVEEITGGWDHSQLPGNVVVGEDCFLERKDSFGRFRSARDPGLVIGAGTRVYMWTTFNVEPSGAIEIGEGSVLVGPTFMCAERIEVGSGVVMSSHVVIADSDFHPRDPELRKVDAIANAPDGDASARPALETAPVVIEDEVHVGIGAIVLKGVRIGRGARIGAGAVVTGDVPASAEVAGNPARPLT